MTIPGGDDVYTSFGVEALGKANVAANVAIDMFLDPVATQSLDPNTHKYEIMVWMGIVGEAYPIGYFEDDGFEYTQMMGDVNL